jgi:tRNA (guanine37-N1)-methyltransferase
MPLHFNLLTLFPEMFPGVLGHSLAGKALERGDWNFNAVNIRDFTQDVHKTVDDTPYGGGAGLVMRPDIIERALLSLGEQRNRGTEEQNLSIPPSISSSRLIYLSPRGKVLDQALVKELSATPEITLLCGRYEGVDQRVLDAHGFEEVSIGDYVLSGGEPAALILMDACIRLLPGVMGNLETTCEESFENGLLEYPHYTKPAEWVSSDGQARKVPEILQSGHHGKIKDWRRAEALKITQERRPDLLRFSQEDTKAQRSQSFSKPENIEIIAKEIVDCAYTVHKLLGPGLLESVYEAFMVHELQKRGLKVKRQIPINIEKEDIKIDVCFRADLIVENCILIELKAIENILPVHKAQTISYLKLSGIPLGFLINFNSALIKDGIRRFVN